MKKNYYFVLGLLCIVIAVCISIFSKNEKISIPSAEVVYTSRKQQAEDVQVKSVVQMKSLPALPPPSSFLAESVQLNPHQIAAEARKLDKPIAQAVSDQIRKHEVLVDMPDYCAFKVNPTDAEAAADIEEKIKDIKASAAPDSKQYAEKACSAYVGDLEEARQFAVVEVMLDKDGFASVIVSRMQTPLSVSFNKWGRYLPDVTGNPGVEVVQSSSGWGPYMEGLYGEARAGKIKQTMAEVKARAMKK